MTDWTIRDVFSLCTGRCGHKWVSPLPSGEACPVCGDWDDKGLVACESIPVSIAYVWDKLARRRARAVREGRRRPRKSAVVVSLTARRFQREAATDEHKPAP